MFSQAEKGSAGHSGEIKFDLIDIAPAPVFTRLVRLHDGMLDCVKVFGRMLVLRGITTTDMATGQAQSQVNPGVPCLQAFFTSLRTRFHITDLVDMRAFVHFLTSRQFGSAIFLIKSISSEFVRVT